MNDSWTPDQREVVRRELVLLDPATRARPEVVFGLLHPDFLEFGASGSVWDAEAIVSQLADELAGERVKTRDESPTQLADDVILLTYAVVHPTAPSLRSSVWIRVDEEWRLRFHQGTRAAAPASR